MASIISQGFFPSHVSKSVSVFGLRLRQVQEIAYKHAVERIPVRGNAREILGWTEGDYNAEFSMTVLFPYWQALKARARSVYNTPPLDMQGDAVITTSNKSMQAQILVVKFGGISEADASSSGGDASVIKLTFNTTRITEDGKSLIANSVYDNPNL